MAKDSKLWESAYKTYKRGLRKRRPLKSQRIKVKQIYKPKPKKPKKERRYNSPAIIYVLKLENDCYYVGQTTNVDRRFKAHVNGKGANWTRRFKPLYVLETRQTTYYTEKEAAKIEDEVTLEYASKYGVASVRGGGYCQSKPRWPVGLSKVKTRKVMPNRVEAETIRWLNSWI